LEFVMKVWNPLKNPFVLVGQGFLAGGLLFWTVQGDAVPQASAQAPSIIASATTR
jgi:hypothetical protein